jgi:hypothetical protein
MTPRHAVALAFVLRYLIAPGGQFDTDSGGGLRPRQWFRLGKFDHEAQCEQAREKIETAVNEADQQDQLAHRKDTCQVLGAGAGVCDSDPLLSGWLA